jgi:acetate kinase
MEPANPRIRTINKGSSSIKVALFEAGDSLRRILEGGIERIGLPEATFRGKGLNQADSFSRSVTAPDRAVAISAAASRAAVLVIHTDEELMIARSVCRVLGLGMASEKGPGFTAMDRAG